MVKPTDDADDAGNHDNNYGRRLWTRVGVGPKGVTFLYVSRLVSLHTHTHSSTPSELSVVLTRLPETSAGMGPAQGGPVHRVSGCFEPNVSGLASAFASTHVQFGWRAKYFLSETAGACVGALAGLGRTLVHRLHLGVMTANWARPPSVRGPYLLYSIACCARLSVVGIHFAAAASGLLTRYHVAHMQTPNAIRHVYETENPTIQSSIHPTFHSSNHLIMQLPTSLWFESHHDR
ncbi:unnamed protein product [Protopolystoma xenopodis]|uniref:Uncharacterized protein n=1 Tax=Protopolystoma xenopodis TaxID=117903 RepID=A0A3S5FG01_9PLAT|nr:unnamed protein product [Protopolystoma xenopodis]